MKLTFQYRDKLHEFALAAHPSGSIGRSRSNPLPIRDHNISRVHVKWEVREDRLRLIDQESRNGLFVNGMRVSEAEVKPGEEFALGNFKLRLEAGEVSPGSSPMPVITETEEDEDRSPMPAGGSKPDADTLLTVRPPAPAVGSVLPSPARPAVTPAPGSRPGPVTPPPAVMSSGPAAPVDPSRLPVLVVRQEGADTEFPVRFQRVSIGTNPDNDLVLQAGKVSRYHAELRQVDQLWIVRDLGSKNGTLVNGQKIEEAVLNDGDRLEVGTAMLTFKWSAKSGGAAGKATGGGVNVVRLGVIGASTLAGLIGLALIVGPLFGTKPKPQPTEALPTGVSDDQRYAEFVSSGLSRLREAMQDGKFDAARRNFDSAVKIEGDAQPLVDLTGFLEKHQPDLLKTPWEEMTTLIEKARKIPNLPQEGRDFLMELADQATYETGNSRVYGDILVQLDGEQYEAAIAGIKKLPERSIYAKKLQPELPNVRQKLKALYLAQIDKQIHERLLHEAIELIVKAQDISDTLDQDLYHKKILCQRSIEDSKRLAEAKDLVRSGKINEAREKIKSIDAKSFCYSEAQEVLAEVERNQLVNDARAQYKEGNGQAAIDLLRGAKLRTSEMDQLAQHIETVLKLYDGGLAARAERDFRSSRTAGQSLVSLEPDSGNFYHQAGLDLQEETPYELAQRSVKAAKEAFAANDLALARAKYEEALSQLPGQKEALEGIKKLSEMAGREYNRIINDKDMPRDKLLTRLKEIRQWILADDRIARAVDNKVRELEK